MYLFCAKCAFSLLVCKLCLDYLFCISVTIICILYYALNKTFVMYALYLYFVEFWWKIDWFGKSIKSEHPTLIIFVLCHKVWYRLYYNTYCHSIGNFPIDRRSDRPEMHRPMIPDTECPICYIQGGPERMQQLRSNNFKKTKDKMKKLVCIIAYKLLFQQDDTKIVNFDGGVLILWPFFRDSVIFKICPSISKVTIYVPKIVHCVASPGKLSALAL